MARDLTKWPRLLVVGEPVTEAQADEILIRTDDWYLFSNDHEWERQVGIVAAKYGRPLELPIRHSADEAYRRMERDRAWRVEFGILDLNYCDNNQIMSAWVGGAHGWCDWTGRIGCSTYNIGKWPSADEVTEDWTLIAGAFPYLDLTAQLINEEGEGELCGQWRVQGGICVYDPEPTEQITPPTEAPWDPATFLLRSRERGVSEGRLRQAMDTVKAARSGT